MKRRLRITEHRAKRLRRLARDLQYWRGRIINTLEEVNRHRFSPEYAEKTEVQVAKNEMILKHIDMVLSDISVQLEVDFELPEIPTVEVKLIEEEVEEIENSDVVEGTFTVKV